MPVYCSIIFSPHTQTWRLRVWGVFYLVDSYTKLLYNKDNEEQWSRS